MRYFYGAVFAVVVDQDAVVDRLGELADGGFQSFLRVVGGQDYGYALAVDHGYHSMINDCGLWVDWVVGYVGTKM